MKLSCRFVYECKNGKMNKEINQANGKHKLPWIVALVAGALVLILGVLYVQNRREMNEYVEVMTEEKQMLTLEYQDLALDYDSLKTNNETINLKLEQERERVAQLLDELKTVKATNALKIRELKKELSTLRNVMQSFVIQIDSLNRRNQQLTAENQSMRSQVNRIQDSYKVLEKQKETLAAKVEIASKLETIQMIGRALTSRDKETDRFSRAAKLKICFVLLKNITAPVGAKTIYLRINRPDGVLLQHSASDKFKFEDAMVPFSASREIEYGGENVDVCIYYAVDEGEMMEGAYQAEVFADGQPIGSVAFKLK